MGNTCPDICDKVIEVMCQSCPNFKTCQNYEDDCNHDQMLVCMIALQMKQYPATFYDCDAVSHKRQYFDPSVRDPIIFGDEEIDWDDRKNYHKEFEIGFKAIHKLAEAGLIDVSDDEYDGSRPSKKFFLETAENNPNIRVRGFCRSPTDENSKWDSGITFEGIDGTAEKKEFQTLVYECRWATELDFDFETKTISAYWD